MVINAGLTKDMIEDMLQQQPPQQGTAAADEKNGLGATVLDEDDAVSWPELPSGVDAAEEADEAQTHDMV